MLLCSIGIHILDLCNVFLRQIVKFKFICREARHNILFLQLDANLIIHTNDDFVNWNCKIRM